MGEKIDFGIKGLIIHNGNYLAVHKAKISDDKYELPGGRMEFGETIEDTLKREIYEELGVEVSPIKLVDTWNYINAEKNYQVAGIIYLCELKENNLDIRLSEEHTDYKWFKIGDVSNMNILFQPRMVNWNWKDLSL